MPMRNDTVVTVRRTDYRPPAFLLERVVLELDLDPASTRVASTLEVRRNQALSGNTGPLVLETQGRRLWLHHGDGLVRGDLGYRALRAVIRHPASIALYGLLHPDLGIPLANRVSRWSRWSRGESGIAPERLWREIALPRFAEGFDTVMVGHFHQVHERREPGREFFVLGDWITRGTYAVLEGGVVRLDDWKG